MDTVAADAVVIGIPWQCQLGRHRGRHAMLNVRQVRGDVGRNLERYGTDLLHESLRGHVLLHGLLVGCHRAVVGAWHL